MLLQSADRVDEPGDDPANWQLKAGEPVDPGVLADLAFAWKACRSVKSNAILLAAGGASVGVGMGQVNRVDSARLAVQRAGDRAAGSVAASDAYFPFPDGFEILAQAGVRAVGRTGRLDPRPPGHRGRRGRGYPAVLHRRTALLPLRGPA
jgi:phosphoribosylaminoimidazolecarboxamide formyltransferase/IMP cyclohydrolase